MSSAERLQVYHDAQERQQEQRRTSRMVDNRIGCTRNKASAYDHSDKNEGEQDPQRRR